MNKAKMISGLITLFVLSPIWYYLIYKILESVHATDLMWFLFWVYVPVWVFSAIVANIAFSQD